MGGHRGGRSKTKRASTSPARVDRNKQSKRLCNSPPSVEPTVKKGRQRSATASPAPDEESLSGEAWAPFISSSTWKKIEAVQTTGIRIILGQPTFVRNSVLLHTVGFIPIQQTIKKNASATFHRIATSCYNHIRTIGNCSPSLYTSRHRQRPRTKPWATS
ncbi:uncharacterized protein LOC132922929 [Rhopalosiphum padi]|uniref:uncharacterized protein LOC132922929 n=1 Tax=Rhopalosiphum padi TaxID=40932 RepID=UPI00298E6A83|nr:uncharacterized protein LOC132922929 [Rhopalosiphum padi]